MSGGQLISGGMGQQGNHGHHHMNSQSDRAPLSHVSNMGGPMNMGGASAASIGTQLFLHDIDV